MLYPPPPITNKETDCCDCCGSLYIHTRMNSSDNGPYTRAVHIISESDFAWGLCSCDCGVVEGHRGFTALRGGKDAAQQRAEGFSNHDARSLNCANSRSRGVKQTSQDAVQQLRTITLPAKSLWRGGQVDMAAEVEVRLLEESKEQPPRLLSESSSRQDSETFIIDSRKSLSMTGPAMSEQ